MLQGRCSSLQPLQAVQRWAEWPLTKGMCKAAAAMLRPYQAGKAPFSIWRGQSPAPELEDPVARSALALGLQLYRSWRRPVLACAQQVSDAQQGIPVLMSLLELCRR